MNKELFEFVRLCDIAAVRATEVYCNLQENGATQQLRDIANITIKNIEKIKESALYGKLPRPSNGAGLGLTREVGEWTEDVTLLNAVRDVERFYRNQM